MVIRFKLANQLVRYAIVCDKLKSVVCDFSLASIHPAIDLVYLYTTTLLRLSICGLVLRLLVRKM